jgi:acyl-[acyl carrier protein]--UDP-N-acetylglucosamine O-acyltransferase
MISKTAVIHTEAEVSPDCRIGDYCVIEKGAVIESGVELGHHVVVHAQTRVGAGTTAGDGCVLGRVPRPAATSTVVQRELDPLVIGKNCTIGIGVVVYRGTEVKDFCFLGDYASLREECKLGETVLVGQRVVVENSVEIGDSSLRPGYLHCFPKILSVPTAPLFCPGSQPSSYRPQSGSHH